MILALESSCDETAAAVADGGRLLSSVVASQAELHAPYGGVVPEVASRRHLELCVPVVERALSEAGVSLDEIDAIAVTEGPGLIGALLVGLASAKALAYARRLPLIPVGHLHGHVASLYLDPEPLEPPFLLLLASGGHTLLAEVDDHGPDFHVIGRTLDDAAGEAFDKGARLLGLGYPGGAALERLAASGDPDAHPFPVSMVGKPGLDLSFSGLKTALRTAVAAAPDLDAVRGRPGGRLPARDRRLAGGPDDGGARRQRQRHAGGRGRRGGERRAAPRARPRLLERGIRLAWHRSRCARTTQP